MTVILVHDVVTVNKYWIAFLVEYKVGASGTYTPIINGYVNNFPATAWLTNTSAYTHGGLTRNTTIYYRVRVFDGAGSSGYSGEAGATTLSLNAPSNLTATAVSSNKIRLDWTDNSSNENRFEIERKTGANGTYASVAFADANWVRYEDTNLTQNAEYYYHIKAIKFGTVDAPYLTDSDYSNEAGATTLTLNAPSNLTAKALSSTQIKLSWADNSADESFFNIERKIGAAGNYTVLATPSANTTTYTDAGLTMELLEEYYYRVRAHSYPNYSNYSNEANAPVITISNVSISSNTINTFASEPTTIFYTIDAPGTVTLRVVPEKEGPTGTPVYQASQTVASAGAYMFTWDGKNNAGEVVPDEAYLYTLEASDGTMSGWYSPSAPTGTRTVICTQDAYDPFKNDPMTVSYTLTEPVRISIGISWPLWSGLTVMDAAPHVPGSYTYDWDGRDSKSNKIFPLGAKAQCSVASLLRENHIITTGNMPKISLLKTDPYEMHLSYGQFTRIKYHLSRDANIIVKLISPTGAAITLVNNESQTTGTHEIEWNGFDPSDVTATRFLVSNQGSYTVWIQAVNPVTGANSIAKGYLRIGY